MKSLQYYVGLKNSPNKMAKLFREHFIQTIAAFKFIGKLRMPSDEMLNTMKVNCARLTETLRESKKKIFSFLETKTLIFDLDETLIHVSCDNIEEATFKMPIKMKNGEVKKVKFSIKISTVRCFFQTIPHRNSKQTKGKMGNHGIHSISSRIRK